MGKRTTFAGYIRSRGATSASSGKITGPTPAVLKMTQAVTVDAAVADGTATGQYLPAGAVILEVTVVSGHTTGTAPLLNIGITGTIDGILNGVVADADVHATLAAGGLLPATGALGATFDGSALAADVEIVAGTGGGVVGTGTSVAYITYTMTDDGAINN